MVLCNLLVLGAALFAAFPAHAQDVAADAAANNTAAAGLKAAVPLRIMALGASVTFGVGSTTGDSYRKDLRDALTGAGSTVNMVGTKRNGNFADNDVQATSGFTIQQIAKDASSAVPQFKPNLVLVDAGTNNCNKGATVPNAGQLVTTMINDILTKSPGATVVLTTILVNSKANQDACRVDINKQYTALVQQLKQQGKKVILVDMRSAQGPTVQDLADGRHPNDRGYQKMSTVWQQGIQQAIQQNMLVAAPTIQGLPANGDDGGTLRAAKGNSTGSAGSTGGAARPTTTGVAKAGAAVAQLSLGSLWLAATALAYMLL